MKGGIAFLALVYGFAVLAKAQSVEVIDIVPATNSAEVNQDSEPSIALNLLDPMQIVISAFTPDPASSGTAPNYVSIDGGKSWTLVANMPGGNTTGDTTLSFGPLSGVLYATILKKSTCTSLCDLDVLTSGISDSGVNPNFTSTTPLTVLLDRGPSNEDQPWAQNGVQQTCTPSFFNTCRAGNLTSSEILLVGSNNFATSPKTASVDVWSNAETTKPPLASNPFALESRTTDGQDLPSTRMAAHRDGTVYAAYFSIVSENAVSTKASLVVTRDDRFGDAAKQFSALLDSSDKKLGQRVATIFLLDCCTVSCPGNGCLGSQRVGTSLSLAVDPTNSSVVYVAWGDGTAGSAWTLHVRKSTDRGQTWSSDLRTIASATNPALAVNTQGTVGFLYQQLDAATKCRPIVLGTGCWATHFEMSSNGFQSVAKDYVLASTPDPLNNIQFEPSIGDYDQVLASGLDFYGVFSAWNAPESSNFPNQVQYKRFADFSKQTLYADADHTSPVNASVDPFFFHIAPTPASQCTGDCAVHVMQVDTCSAMCSDLNTVAALYHVTVQQAPALEGKCNQDCLNHDLGSKLKDNCAQQQVSALKNCNASCGGNLGTQTAACTSCLNSAAGVFAQACGPPITLNK